MGQVGLASRLSRVGRARSDSSRAADASKRPMTSAMRSPEMSIPRTIAKSEHDVLRQASSRPRMLSICVEDLARRTQPTHVDQRAGQTARQGGAAQHHCGDRPEQVGRTRRCTGALDQTR